MLARRGAAPIGIASIGLLSAFGHGLVRVIAGMRDGVCPRAPATGIGYPLEPAPLVSRFDSANYPRGDRGAAAALIEVVQQAVDGLGADAAAVRRDDCALVIGTGGFLYASGAELYGRAMGTVSSATPFRVRGPSWGADLVRTTLAMEGPQCTLSTGCSSSANALLCAIEMLQRHQVERALVVGAEGLSAVTLSGFDSLMLLDAEGCRPFDRDRNGLQIGEGIGAMVLTAHRAAGGRTVLLGGANRCDTHHLTSASPDGTVMREVMHEALDTAGVNSRAVIAIKAHGTGSRDSDQAEASALHAVFGAEIPPVTALKRYLGHTLGACGTLELAAFAGCLESGFVPSAIGFANADPELQLSPLRTAIAARPGPYLLNFFGFGGNYTSLVVALD